MILYFQTRTIYTELINWKSKSPKEVAKIKFECKKNILVLRQIEKEKKQSGGTRLKPSRFPFKIICSFHCLFFRIEKPDQITQLNT